MQNDISIQNTNANQWLYQRFLEIKQTQPKLSLRLFSKKIGVPPSAVSEIFSGKRIMTAKMATKIGTKLKLNPVQMGMLLRSISIGKAFATLPQDDILNELTDKYFQTIDLDTFKFMAHWYYFAILSFSEVEGNRYDPNWISERLGISLIEAREALRTLERLKLIERRGKSFVQSKKPLSIETKGYENAIQTFLKQNMKMAARALETVPAEDREVSSITMAINPDQLPKARTLVKRFRRELCELLETGKKTRVFSFNVQLFPLDQQGRKNESHHH